MTMHLYADLQGTSKTPRKDQRIDLKIIAPEDKFESPAVWYGEALNLLTVVTQGRLKMTLADKVAGWAREEEAQEEGPEESHQLGMILMILRELIFREEHSDLRVSELERRCGNGLALQIAEVKSNMAGVNARLRGLDDNITKITPTVDTMAALYTSTNGVVGIKATSLGNAEEKKDISELQATSQQLISRVNSHGQELIKRFAEIQESINNIGTRIGELSTVAAAQGQAITILKANEDNVIEGLKKAKNQVTVVNSGDTISEATLNRLWKEGFEPQVQKLKDLVGAEMRKVQDACAADIGDIKGTVERLRQSRTEEEKKGARSEPQPSAPGRPASGEAPSAMGAAAVAILKQGADNAERKDQEETDFVQALLNSQNDKVAVLPGSHRCKLCTRIGHYAAECRAQCYCPACQTFGTHPAQGCPNREAAAVKYCNRCQVAGHATEECRGLVDQKGNLKGKGMGQKGKFACYNCGEAGHMAKNCPHPRKALGPKAGSKNGKAGRRPGKKRNQKEGGPERKKAGKQDPKQGKREQKAYRKGQRVAAFSAYTGGYPTLQQPIYVPVPAPQPITDKSQALVTALMSVLAQFQR